MAIVNLNGSAALQSAAPEPMQLQTPMRATDALSALSSTTKTVEEAMTAKADAPAKPMKNIEQVKEVVAELNEYMDDLQTNLGFSIHEELNHQVVVEIKNRQTDELVRQIPSEALLNIREKMIELTGMFFDMQA